MKMTLILILFVSTFSWSDDRSCRSRIPDLICLVESPKIEKDRYRGDRSCIKGDTSRFLKQLQWAYDAYPGIIQKQFCSLTKIYLEKDFFGGAWSDTGGIIGINKSLSDAQPDAGNALSGFDQLSFGGKKPGYEPSLKYPTTKVVPVLEAITHTLLHELAHTLDYQYDFQKKGWAQLSGADFELRKSICLNSCGGKTLSESQVPLLYQELSKHAYVSQLSSISPMEDFAETFTFVVEHDLMNRRMTVETGKSEIDPLSTSEVSAKVAFVRKVIRWLNSETREGWTP